MKLSEILVGKRVRATRSCNDAVAGRIYEINVNLDAFLLKGTKCGCVVTWEVVDPIIYKPEPHKHVLKCAECGEATKK